MSIRDRNLTGTRFRLFPQSPFSEPGRRPETVWISTPPDRIGPGPSDDLVYLIHPIGKRLPYGVQTGPDGRPFLYLPPWRGPILPPVQPDADGNFDHIPVGTPEFEEAHVFGSIRFTMDQWERYFGHPLRWHFARDFDRLEAVILPSLDNAHAGYGYMEIGADHREDGSIEPFSLNFDVIAHEFGHLIIYGTIGVPRPGAGKGEYFGFHESAADMVAILAALNFETMLDDLLEQSSGNLYSFNELNRFAELSATDQIRMASNPVKMWQFAAGWEDEHKLSQPLTGALFDILVDVFQEILVDRGLIPRGLADLSDMLADQPGYNTVIQPYFDAIYPDNRAAFREALIAARDYMGVALAETWERLSPDYFDYAEVAETLMDVDRALSGGRNVTEMAESFRWRGIGQVEAGPRLSPPDERSHAHSSRTAVPAMIAPSKSSYRERRALALSR